MPPASTFLDGFSSAFLAGLLFPLVSTVVLVLFTGSGRTGLGDSVAALVAGPLLGGSVGLGLWRAAVTGRIAGTSKPFAPAALGVAAGLVLGQLASLAGTGSGVAGGLDHPAWLAVSAVLGAGATALSAGLAQLGSDAVPRLHRRVTMVAIVVIGGLIFASALWIASTLQFVLDTGGLALARAWLVTLLPSADLVIATVAVLALSAGWALWARTRRAAAPAWMTEGGNPLAWPSGGIRARQWVTVALACGVVAEGCLLAFRFIAGPAFLPRPPGAAVLPLHLGGRGGRRRVHPGPVLAGPGPRDRSGVPGRAAGHADRGGRVPGREHRPRRQPQRPLRGHRRAGPPRPRAAVRPGRGPGRADPAGLAVARGARPRPASARFACSRRSRSRSSAPPPCPRCSSPAAGRSSGRRPALVPGNSGGSSLLPPAQPHGLRYLNTTAPAIEAAYARVQRSVAAAGAAASPALAAAIIRAEVLPPLRRELRYTESIDPGTAQLAAIHRHRLAAFGDAITEYSLFAQAFQNNDAGAYARAKTEQRAANEAWLQWQIGLLSLRLGGGIPATP